MAAVAPASLREVRDPYGRDLFPTQALSESKTALVVFCAAFHGMQDAYWVAEAGLQATCVDTDSEMLAEMRAVYPTDWEFVAEDAFYYGMSCLERFDVVTLDPFTMDMSQVAANMRVWCDLARNVVIVGHDIHTRIEAPHGWQIVHTIQRSDKYGGIFWSVLERTGQGISAKKVTACLLTRGDVDMAPIIGTLPYDEILVWNRRERDEHPGTFGRYRLMNEARHDVIYLQDDDCVFRHHDKLMLAYDPGRITAVYGHGDTPDGYDDMALIHGGALVDREVSLAAFDRYLEEWPQDEGFYREADMIHGTLSPFRHVHLPYEIRMEIAQHPSRMVNQPWQRELKKRVTDRARHIR